MGQQPKETIEPPSQKIEQASELTNEQLDKVTGGTVPMHRPKKFGRSPRMAETDRLSLSVRVRETAGRHRNQLQPAKARLPAPINSRGCRIWGAL